MDREKSKQNRLEKSDRFCSRLINRRISLERNRRRKGLQAPNIRGIIIIYGLVKVSTGVLQPEKLSAGDASNRKPKLNAKNDKVVAFRAPVALAA